MKEINLPSGNYLFVEVPNDAFEFIIQNRLNTVILYKDSDGEQIIRLDVLDNFEIISTTKDITEEQAETIVESHKYNEKLTTYKDYMFLLNLPNPENEELFDWMYPKQSLISLIRANGLDFTKNYLILKKN